jgi:hypothetical protein
VNARRHAGRDNREQIKQREEIMNNGATRSGHSRQGSFGSAHAVAAINAVESAEKSAMQGDDAAIAGGSIGIGMATGGPIILGGARSAELLQLFIENL